MFVLAVVALGMCILLWVFLNPYLPIYPKFRGALPNLKFVNDTFTIVQFADLHFGESDQQDFNSIAGMKAILAAEERVDLVVFTGDQITGDMISNLHKQKEKWIESLSVVGELRIPFLTLFGNHDDVPYYFPSSIVCQFAWYLVILLSVIASVLMALTLYTKKHAKLIPYVLLLLAVAIYVYLITGPSDRIRSYLHRSEADVYPDISYSSMPSSNTKNVFLPLTANGKVIFSILALDSGGGRLPLKSSKLFPEWFSNRPDNVKEFEFLSFVHVPTTEFKGIYSSRCLGEQNEEPSNIYIWAVSFNHVLGDLMDLKNRAVFAAHNHGNDWCCRYNEWLSLCYGRHSGYGGYGDWKRGARVIRLKLYSQNQVEIQSWLTMVDGSKRNFGII